MAETFTGNVKVSISGALATTTQDIGNIGYSFNYTTPTYTFTNGTSTNQANMVWADTRTIVASGTDDLDLAGGLTNAFGTALTFTKMKGILVAASSANTNNVLIGGDAAALANWVSNVNDVVVVRPGGVFCLIAPDTTGYAVTGTTADVLQIANSSSGTSVTYDIILIGCV